MTTPTPKTVEDVVEAFEERNVCEHHVAQRCDCADKPILLRTELTALLQEIRDEIAAGMASHHNGYPNFHHHGTCHDCSYNSAKDADIAIIEARMK